MPRTCFSPTGCPTSPTTPHPGRSAVTLDGAPLAEGVDYISAWTTATAPGTTEKQLSLDFYDTTATVDTPIPGGSTLQVVFPVTIDDGVGAGAQLDNIRHRSPTTRTQAERPAAVDLTTNNGG